MSESEDLIQLYSRRILALAADIPHAERLAAPSGSATRRSPLCGSTVTVDVAIDGERISGFGQDVKACALGQASAAVLGSVVIGRNRAEVETARDQLKAMLKDGGEPPQAPFEGLEALKPARDYRNRHASILLAYDATLDDIDDARARARAEA